MENWTIADPEFGAGKPCSNYEPPAQKLGPHVASLGLKFYTGSMFPAEYRNVLFNARRGSWNRTKKIGFDVVTVRATADGRNAKIVPFMTGFMNEADQSFWGRPSYFLQMKDGSVLVSDEQTGAIYRVSYKAPGRGK